MNRRTDGQKSFYLAETDNAGMAGHLQIGWFKKSPNFRENLPAVAGNQ